jgi:hypothetical protein
LSGSIVIAPAARRLEKAFSRHRVSKLVQTKKGPPFNALSRQDHINFHEATYDML